MERNIGVNRKRSGLRDCLGAGKNCQSSVVRAETPLFLSFPFFLYFSLPSMVFRFFKRTFLSVEMCFLRIYGVSKFKSAQHDVCLILQLIVAKTIEKLMPLSMRFDYNGKKKAKLV